MVLYVDDLTLTWDDQLIHSCKDDLVREFKMKDTGLMHYFIGLEVWQGDGELFVIHGKYSSKILQIFHMDNFTLVDTPLATNWRKEDASSGEIVDATIYIQFGGSLMYLVNIRPDICYAVNQLSQAMVEACYKKP